MVWLLQCGPGRLLTDPGRDGKSSLAVEFAWIDARLRAVNAEFDVVEACLLYSN